MIKKFVVAVIVFLGLFMVSCAKGDEETAKATYIPEGLCENAVDIAPAKTACFPEKLWKNTVDMGRELINGDNISEILNETIIRVEERAENDTTSDAIDYGDYLHKIWVLDRWDDENTELERYEEYSFYINEIKDCKIKGRVTRWGITNPGESKQNFQGIIENGIGECQFDMGDGYKGNFYFEIRNTNELIVEFKYTYSDDMGKTTVYERKGVFKPYNLSMVEEVTVAKTVEVDLDLWGTAWIAVGWFDTSTRHVGAAYLINKNGDILYDFHAPYRTGMWIVNAYLEDLNGDGLPDIKIMERDQTGLPNLEDPTNFEAQEDDYEWHFLRREDGYFEEGLLIFG